MTWSPLSIPAARPGVEPSFDELRLPPSILAEASSQVLEALGLGVLACDASLRIVAASAAARAMLGRLPAAPAPDFLPDLIADAVRANDRWPVRVGTAGRIFSVWAKPARVGNATMLVWLRPEVDTGELDAAMRRRWHLTPRQIDLVHELRQGYRNQEIAQHLGLTCSTVKSYLSHLFGVLGVRSRGEAIALIERVRRGE